MMNMSEKPTATDFEIAAYQTLAEEKHHYDNLSWVVGGIVLVFAGAVLAEARSIKAEHYWAQVLLRLLASVAATLLVRAWQGVYERNRMWGEAANEAMRDLELRFDVRGAGLVFRELALSGKVKLKNTDGAGEQLIVDGEKREPRIERPETTSMHAIVPTCVKVAYGVALISPLIP
jgi:hypothetical protein